jgi:enoyl-[acyl-carrier protein] reductase III
LIDLSGQVALVTGGSRGIGAAISRAFAKAGADVALTYLNARPDAEDVGADVMAAGKRALVLKADLSESEDVGLVVEATKAELGRIDIVVSNAAGGGFRSLMEVTPENLDYALHLNVRAFMLLLQSGATHLERKEGEKRSHVLSISSWGAERALPMYGAIGASKAALESMTRHAALELGGRGVNVNCIRAGVVDTGALRSLAGVEAVLEERAKKSLTGRNVMPEDVANAALFLVSPLADMVQGQTLILDGGTSLHP